MTIRKLLPRVELRRLDNLTGRFPSIARTGSRRLGNYKIFFNDQDTIIFATGSITSGTAPQITYPTAFVFGANYALDLTSSIVTTGSSRPGTSDIFGSITRQVEQLNPFTEFGLHEQDNLSASFIVSGSDLIDFSQNIRSKTQIRIRLPIFTETQLYGQTSSLYYYNSIHGLFEEMGPGLKENPGNSGGFAFDSKLFNAFGMHCLSGSVGKFNPNFVAGDTNAFPVPHPFATRGVGDVLGQAMQFFTTQSAIANMAYAVTVSQSIAMSDYIAQPFLLEKATIEFPIKAGNGWFGDITRTRQGDPSQGHVVGSGADFGGPAVTVSLLKQVNNSKRDIILSGCFIPGSDNISEVESEFSSAANQYWFYVRGFNSFATPATVVNLPTGSFFTGSVRLDLEARVSAGIASISTQSLYYAATPWVINPMGRSKQGYASGRSLRSEYVAPGNFLTGSVNQKFSLPTGSSNVSYYTFVQENGIYSPYLLLPNDNITLAISKQRPVKKTPFASSINNILTGSHDIGITSGFLNITLYGSLLRENKEYHNTLNQLLTTNAIHEPIQEIITDQFDVAYREELTGTYVDYVTTGSLITKQEITNALIQGTKILATSRVSSSQLPIGGASADSKTAWYENYGFSRNISLFSEHERFYDSMPPNIIDVVKIDNGTVIGTAQIGANTIYPMGVLCFDCVSSSYTSEIVSTGVDYGIYTDNNWTKAYPFEAKYSRAARQLGLPWNAEAVSTLNITNASAQGLPVSISTINTVIANNFFTVYMSGSSVNKWNMTYDQNTSGSLFSPTHVIKWLYGIGDLNTAYYISGIGFGGTTLPLPRFKTSQTSINGAFTASYFTHEGSILRGWKYGLLSGLPTFTKAVFRRDHYGQLRDMLEQRQYSKFYDIIGINDKGNRNRNPGALNAAVNISFVDNTGKKVDPLNTFSSNLSFECTSSVPFIDGNVRNREDPLRNIGVKITSLI